MVDGVIAGLAAVAAAKGVERLDFKKKIFDVDVVPYLAGISAAMLALFVLGLAGRGASNVLP